MLYFNCDYMEGAHPSILNRLMETNMEHTLGYGSDLYCESAKEKIRKACRCPEAEVHFLVGGTQTNATVIKGVLKPYEGVLAAVTGHIGVHEAGAIEAGGHKVLTLPQKDGKIDAGNLKEYLEAFYRDGSYTHMVQPGMVYISHPTEYGTLYTKKELTDLKAVCEAYNLPLFLDGARLGYGLMAVGTDVTLQDIAQLCDAFYIGGTKVGALFGEAVVFPKKKMLPGFFTLIKQQGALLAKGRLLGIQFDTLFTDDLYFEISKHAIEMAQKLKNILVEAGCPLFIDSPTNQQFVILSKEQEKFLEGKVSYEFWQEVDENHNAVRFAASWATKEADLEELEHILADMPK
ncbi:MAG: aminotransferase class V-fold PLP-dependent enzyme [Lachnospiraceae bacterium]|nr:aminotransferase class V-fold PLP-dependent enzyme [Lachnospiraceae bacterium]